MRDLGTERLSWDDLAVIVVQRKPDSAISRSVDPHAWFWTPDRRIAADLLYQVEINNWIQLHGSIPPPTPLYASAADATPVKAKNSLPESELRKRLKANRPTPADAS
ncbi:hypothetical protein [Rhodococcus triatomae]